jgi:hypothetical protein
MKSIANMHLYQFLPVLKGKKSYRQICLDIGQFDSFTNCSHSTLAAVRENLLKRQYKLTVGKHKARKIILKIWVQTVQ